MKTFYFVFILGLFFITSANAQIEVVKPKFGKGIFFTAPDSSMTMKLGFRFQTLFTAQSPLAENADIKKNMMIRRTRLKFDGFVYDPRVVYKVELALSNRDIAQSNIKEQSNAANIVLDAVLKYALRPNLHVWFGQTKLPGNRERVISSQLLQFVDRSLVNSFYTLDRDLGVQIHHQFNIGQVVIRDKYAISIGQGRNFTAADTSGFSYTGRLEVLPFGLFTNKGDYFSSDLAREEKPKVSLAAGYSYNDGAVRRGGELGPFLSESRDLKTFFADFMLKYRGWSVMSEYMNKQSDQNPLLADSSAYFRTGHGLTVQSGYLFKNNFEIAGRYSVIDPSTALIAAGKESYIQEYTLGVSRYIVGHNLKIQSDVSFIDDQANDHEDIRFRLQMEMAF